MDFALKFFVKKLRVWGLPDFFKAFIGEKFSNPRVGGALLCNEFLDALTSSTVDSYRGFKISFSGANTTRDTTPIIKPAWVEDFISLFTWSNCPEFRKTRTTWGREI